jgi:hypothetical protein
MIRAMASAALGGKKPSVTTDDNYLNFRDGPAYAVRMAR